MHITLRRGLPTCNINSLVYVDITISPFLSLLLLGNKENQFYNTWCSVLAMLPAAKRVESRRAYKKIFKQHRTSTASRAGACTCFKAAAVHTSLAVGIRVEVHTRNTPSPQTSCPWCPLSLELTVQTGPMYLESRCHLNAYND
jgi:hypothetical protein